MQNIYLQFLKNHSHHHSAFSHSHYQPSSNALLLLHQQHITKYTYDHKCFTFHHAFTFGPIEELNQTVLMLEDLVEAECVVIATEEGTIFTIDKQGEVDIKAQNQDGILAATVSPSQEYMYVVTKNKSIIQLNTEYDLVNEIPLDPSQEVVDSRAQFTWRGDGNFFVINYKTAKGHKAVTKDIMMATFISPSKSDPNEDGLVQSVSEKGRQKMAGVVSWQPSGSIVAGIDYVLEGEKKRYRVIFWQKNGLRHLEFKLPSTVVQVNEMFWSYDSTILFVKAVEQNGQIKLLVYFRSNYHWYLKSVVTLQKEDHCLPLYSQKQKHQLLLIKKDRLEVLEYGTQLPEKEWKLQEEQNQFKHQFFYFVDGPIVNITDLSKCLMPPPMSMIKAEFGADVVNISKKRHNLLVITHTHALLYDFIKQSIVDRCDLGDFKGQLFPSLRLLKNDEIEFVSGSRRFHKTENGLSSKQQHHIQTLKYSYISNQHNLILQITYENSQLTINNNLICQQCSSFTFYHQFLLFTVSTSDMYDKLFVLNLTLDDWVYQDDSKVKSRLAEIQGQELLNHRLVERGARIVTVCAGRVVLQLPRGNLEAIYPKAIMINQVQKHISKGQYRLAFQTVRTHKLDFNLLYDIDLAKFSTEIDTVLKDIKRVDYINLLISQITDTLSSQMRYLVPLKQYQNRKSEFELSLKGKKVKSVCKIISSSLRSINSEQYILSIYTSQIREGKLNDVLFEIKQAKAKEKEMIVPPHLLEKDVKKQKKKLSSEQILEYVCWLVDANAIYEASLLTYDLQLAAMTARCTQKDPKEYIPYLESLKQLQDQVQFKAKIALDLKKYDIAVKELSKGNPEQVSQSLSLIKKQKLYKQGLTIYQNREELKKVKQFIIEELLSSGEVNEAYRIAQSTGMHERALEIAKGAMDTKKIKECLQIIYQSKEERIKIAEDIISDIKDQIKNRIDLAKLYVFVEKYEDAVSLFLKYNEYKKAYKYLWKVSPEFRQRQMKEGFQLCFSVKKNQIIRDKKDFLDKYGRLQRLHKEKLTFGEPSTFKARDNDDMYSEVSMSSKAQSSYTMSTTTGMRKKKDKKRSILTRNVKEGSPLEEEYLLAYIQMLEDKVQDAVKDSKLLVQHLIYMNLIEEAEILRDEVREYIELFNSYPVKSFAKSKFEEAHPEAAELYFQTTKLSALSIDSFNYLF